jgi:tripartite-type tricarboxylate transporter receptor subunit TctC
MDDVKRRFEDQGVEPVGGAPSRFGDHVGAEIQKWAKVVKDANIKPE